MSAALRSNIPPRSQRQERLTRQRQVEANWVEGTSALAPDRRVVPLTAVPDLSLQPGMRSPATVESLPLPTEMPLWLRAFTAVQQGTLFLAWGLAAVVLTAYAVNVYSQQSWGKVYQELQLLRRNERQLISANEILRNQLAQQADQAGTGLVNPKPQHMIFLEPTPVTPGVVVAADPLPMAIQGEPIGY